MLQKNTIWSATTGCIVILLSIQWTTVISATPTTVTTAATTSNANKLTKHTQSLVVIDDDSATDEVDADDLTKHPNINYELYNSSEYQDDLDVPYESLKNKLHQQHEQQLEQHKQDYDYEWDLLIFTQQWPVTTCYHWREEDKNHECKLPTKKEFWTIHGIWPTKLGQFGPSFCNKSAEFDVDKIEKIMSELRQFWPDIDGEDQELNWLWKHEWLKHGTCAALLEQLNNEFKYFEQALDWRESYLISNMLGSSNIHPDSNNTVVALHTALFKALGKNPSIHCLYDSKNDISYLAEIRICFNKTLQLTDCDGVKLGVAVTIDYPGGKVLTNCHISKPVHYPSLVPSKQPKQHKNWKFPIVNIYKLLQFIMWITL